MRTCTKSLFLGVAVLFITVFSYSDTVDRIDAMISQQSDRSISVAFREGFGSEPRFLHSGGDRDVYDVASIGKVVTAAVALQMAAEGTFALDQPVFDDLGPEWREADGVRQVTPAMLLSHTAGYSNSVVPIDRQIRGEPGETFSYSGAGIVALQEFLEGVSGRGLEDLARSYVFQKANMNDSSFIVDPTKRDQRVVPHTDFVLPLLLSLIPALLLVLVGSGIAFAVARVRSRTFGGKTIPFLVLGSGMLNVVLIAVVLPRFLWISLVLWIVISVLTVLVHVTELRLWVAAVILIACVGGYTLWGGGETAIRADRYSVPVAAYTLQSTAADLARFAAFLIDDLGPETPGVFEEAVRVHSSIGWTYALAFEEQNGRRLYWQWGSNMGFKSLLVLDTATGSYLAVLSNADSAEPLTRAIAGTAFGEEYRFQLPD